MPTAVTQQSGLVTPGHAAVWVTDNVIADGGAVPAAARVLASERNVNFNTTADLAILLPPAIQAFQLTGIIVTNANLSLTNAQGGFYTGTGKTGQVLVLAAQTYAALTSQDLLIQLPLTTYAQSARFSTNNLLITPNAANLLSLEIFFSLTIPQGVPAVADLYLLGVDLS